MHGIFIQYLAHKSDAGCRSEYSDQHHRFCGKILIRITLFITKPQCIEQYSNRSKKEAE
ncbi:hypothetical protein D3C81_1483010 [compost metagenome]